MYLHGNYANSYTGEQLVILLYVLLVYNFNSHNGWQAL